LTAVGAETIFARLSTHNPSPEGRYGPDHDCTDLDSDKGMVLLDAVAGTIVHVEVLNRDDIRIKLISQIP
jgi:hypothetical protein